MNAAIQNPVIQKCKEALVNSYGRRLMGVILYGSMARRMEGKTSDIDLLVLLSPPMDYLAELRRLVDVLYPIQLESDRLISAKPVLAEDYESGSLALYRNAARDGVAV